MKLILLRYQNLPIKVKATSWFIICAFLQKAISVITTPVFTRLLSSEEFGRYNVFQSWMGIIQILVSLALSAGVYIQGLVKFDREREALSSSLQGLTLLLVTAWSGVYLIFHNLWNRITGLSTVQMLAMLMMIWTAACFGFWAAEQRTMYRYRLLVVISIAVAICKPVISIMAVLHANDKVTARILSVLIVEMIAYAWMFFSQMRRGRVFYSGRFWKYALTFNIPLVPHYLSQSVLSGADRIMIERIIGESEAGLYSLAYQIASFVLLFNAAMLQGLNPWMYQKIKDHKEHEMEKMVFFILVMCAGINLILILIAPEMISVFAPTEYYDAVYAVPPVAISTFFVLCYDIFAKHAFYYEKTGFVMITSVSAAITNVLLNLVFIKRYGYIAAGYTTLICYIIYAAGHYVFMLRVCDDYCDGIRPYSLKRLILMASVFLILGMGMIPLYQYSIARYVLIGVTVVLVVLFRRTLTQNMMQILKLKNSDQ